MKYENGGKYSMNVKVCARWMNRRDVQGWMAFPGPACINPSDPMG